MNDSYDVVVIGGGPAGSTVATLVAEQGHSVLVAERDPFPRFKIGESLMPASYHTFERLGVLDELKASTFPRKYSVQFYSKSGRASQPFYFFETNPHESSQTWQVRRAEFDQLLVDNARKHGAEVEHGINVRGVVYEAGRAVGLDVEVGGEARRINSKVVVDASGQSAMLARSRGLIEMDPVLRKAAVFTHVTGAVRDSGMDEGATLVIHNEDASAWFWFIPLLDGITSVGVVGGLDTLIGRKRTAGSGLPRVAVAGGEDSLPQRIFEEELAKTPALAARMSDAQQVEPMRVLKEFSYRSRELSGDGWVLVGDAYAFLDPIYSSGVLLALESGQMAAESINAALAVGRVDGAALGAHRERYVAGVEAFRNLVYAFYSPEFSFAKFLKDYPGRRLEIVDMLVGDVFGKDHDELFAEMATMCMLPGSWPQLAPTEAS